MTFNYISSEEALSREGVRMVVVRNVPSPWGEAAKGLFHMKGINWAAVPLAQDDPTLDRLTGGEKTAPVVIHGDEAPRSGWADILIMAEGLSPTPPLIPAKAMDRALMFGLSHELMGEHGLAWWRRIQGIHAGLTGQGGWPQPVCQYLAAKYGYTPTLAETATQRVTDLLSMLTERLQSQSDAGSPYYIGVGPTAADIYSAVCMAMFDPLPEAQCAMNPVTRAAFSIMDEATRSALDPILLTHRDRMYGEHLALPLSL